MRTTFVTLMIAALLLVVSGAQGAERSGGPSTGDLVRVTVYGQPDLTTLARVSNENTITFPFIGEVRVGGVSITEAQANIARALIANDIVRDPQVNLLIEGVAAGDLVTVLGQVRQPGRYPLVDGAMVETRTLLDLLAVAGGTTDTASTRIAVFRSAGASNGGTQGERTRSEIDLHELMNGGNLGSANLELRSGDIVVVPDEDVFYIYGQVSKPGRYPLLRDMMVMHAISVGGGMTDRGSETGLVMTRRENNRQESRTVGLGEAVRPGDVIYVKESFF